MTQQQATEILRELATDPDYGAPDGPGREGYLVALEHVEVLAGL